MRKNLIFLMASLLALTSCQKEHNTETETRQVVMNFSTKAMSDIATKSAASASENAVQRVAIIGVDNNGDVQQRFPVIENPQMTGTTLSLQNNIKRLYVIANPTAELSMDVANVSALEAMTISYAQTPSSPFVMSSKIDVNSNSLNVDLLRSVAKLEVLGKNGFEVTAVTVTKTPNKSYIFDITPSVAVPASATYVEYVKHTGNVVYVAENTKANPTTLFVEGTFNGQATAYTISLSKDNQPLDIDRNTCYQVSVTPISESQCSVNVTIPEWNDLTADDNFIPNFGTYRSVDFHQHTGFSDGSHPITFVLNQAKVYGLDITVNSEHGGAFSGNASDGDQEVSVPTWAASGLLAADFKGDVNGSGNTQKMWRWQSIKEYSFGKVAEFNSTSTTTLAVQGLEWNPPGHEHCSSGIITGQFGGMSPNADAMAQFEYMFDNNDADQTGGAAEGWVKSTKTGHEKSMEAAKWLQDNHRLTSWLVPAHPERQNRWLIQDYRDMNDVAPDVFVAFESIPGHQASTQRGGYGNTSSFGRTYTYGGVGVQSAKIGGLWDAMISEGRRFWLVANSDYHSHVSKGSGDFYPGEYQKTHIAMKDKTAQSFVDGLRAGNIYTVHGDLINRLEFSVGTATMGQTYDAKTSSVKVRILVNDPEASNFNTYTALTNPSLDHIDLIAGEMRPKVAKGSADYSVDTYSNVKVIARFDANGGITDGNGITSVKWRDLGGGLKLVEYTINVTGDTYFRLRGTNHGLNVVGRTDANGNPLEDAPTASVAEGAKLAFENLWFYSNPIFVRAN